MITVTGRVLHLRDDGVIELFAEPPTSKTSHLSVGQREHWTRVAASVPSDNGRFDVPIAPANLRRFANPDGIVNMQVFAATGHKFSAYGLSASLAGRSDAVSAGTMRLWPAATKRGFPAIASWLAKPTGAIPGIGCATPQLIKLYKPKWGKIGWTSIIIGGGEHQQFTYKHDQNSSLGLAWAQNDWAESGTKSISSSSSVPYKKKGDKSSWVYKTQFRYGEYSAGECGVMTQVHSYYGGSQTDKSSKQKATHCARYEAGTSPQFTTSKAATFSAGIPVPVNAGGITLSAQTGWDTSGYITYSMGSHSHDICGAKDGPGGKPGWIVVGLP